jgi:exodeoxyribonuclease V beta subunit
MQEFACAAPPEHIDASWGLASFSGFTSRKPHLAARPDGSLLEDRPDRDELSESDAAQPVAVEEPVGRTIFGFPRGTRTGNCWHELFEELDFTGTDPDALGSLVRTKLTRCGFPLFWEDAVSAMVRNVLDAPLLGSDSDFRLAQVGWADRLVELEFHLPIPWVDPEALADAIRGRGTSDWAAQLAGRVRRLGFRTVRGLLKGFIDLVFRHQGRYYVLDWKSNHLGNGFGDYAPNQLAAAMREHDYDLQYLLYTVALHRYLGQRIADYDYDRHMGGAVYLFLRGIDAGRDPSNGIHRGRPERSLVEGLDRYLHEGVGYGA